MSGLTFAEAVVVGAFQGVTELFPVSSLGHSVLVPALVGGRWADDLSVLAPESPYLAFIVGLHVGTAAALLVFFWRDWLSIVVGFATSLRYRRMQTPAERLAWLLILSTIPVGVAGLALEHVFRTTLGKPMPAAIFLMVNGTVLLAGERLRRRAPARITVGASDGESQVHDPDGLDESDQRLSRMAMSRGVLIGSAQILALLPGISRSGVTMVAGLRGLNHDDAARFSFLLATPVIVAPGLAGCSSNKASNGSSTAATGNGSAKVTIDGKDQTVSGKIACVTTGNQVSIQLGDPSGGLQAVLTTDNPPKVNAVQLGKVSGQVLQYAPGAGDATATKDGNNYKISGHALGGVDMSNPMAGLVSKAFNIDVTCP